MRLPPATPALALTMIAACASSNPPPQAPPSAPAPPSAASAPPAGGDAGAPAPKTAADAFVDECRGHIDAARGLLAQTLAVAGPRTVESTLEPYNQLSIHLNSAGMKAGLLAEVHPDPAFRAAAEQCVKDVSSYTTEVSQNPALHAALSAVDTSHADEVTRRMVAHTLRDFRRAGVDKDEATRKRLKALSDEMTATGLEFDKNIREDVHTVKLDRAQLEGLPEDYVKAHPAGADGKVTITTDYPDALPFRVYAQDRAARKALYVEFLSRGYPKNDEILRKLLRLRREFATTLGYKDWADYDTETRMIRTGQAARDFIERITKAADKRAHHDYAELLARKRKDDPKATGVEDWEKFFYADKVKREKYAFDSQAVRPYFEFTQTRDGLLAVTAKMYGIEYRPVPDAPRWDPSVDVFDVMKDGAKMGRIYLDLHPRDGKYKHAAEFTVVPGVAGVQLPEASLVCNFPDPKKGEALMDHEDVVTMFHEFGKGSDARQQMFYAALSLGLHQQEDPGGADFVATTKDVQGKYGLFPYVEGTHFYDNFGHLNGYGAAYYTYMWSLVIAKDLLTEFKAHGLMDPATDKKYRDLVLAPGGSKDAAALLHDFLGRDYDFKAYEAWLNEK